MAKKDKKAKEAEKKARNAQKQEKKAVKKDKKVKSKGKTQDVDSDADDDQDLDAILEEYARQQEQFLQVTEDASGPPSARTSTTLVGSPSNENEIFVFGGEYYDGSLAKFYNDLYVYNVSKDTWRRVTSPNSPLPRSGHAWTRGGNTGGVYLFGGEFSSPKQGTFYHYNDFWRLDPSSREWTRIEVKGKGATPPSRSGHRLTYFKNYIILFGGFQDTAQQTRYLNDLWVYDCSNFTWFEPKLVAGSGKPDARSSFSLLPHETGAVMYGGYSRVKASVSVQQKGGKKGKGGAQGASRMTLKPVIHQDTWFLRITPPASDSPNGTLPTIRWERRKRPANAPSPPRAGATMCAHKGRGISFGGVHDVEESEEGIDSEFFSTLHAWNVDRNRFFELSLRRPKASGKKAAAADQRGGRRDRGRQAEEDLLRNLQALELKGGISEDSTVSLTTEAEKEKEEETEKIEKPVTFEMPHPRFNAQVTVQGDMLYIFGGTFEKDDREYTFDELWAVDLNKLDGVREIFRRELPQDWKDEVEEDDSEEEDEDEDEDDEEEDEDSVVDEADAPSNPATSVAAIEEESTTTAEESSALTDGLPFPRPFESLRDFFDRTKITWQEVLIASLTASGDANKHTPKELSTIAFARAEEKWWDCREEIRVLEDEQTDAGIGEVVSLADKVASGGAGRRR